MILAYTVTRYSLQYAGFMYLNAVMHNGMNVCVYEPWGLGAVIAKQLNGLLPAKTVNRVPAMFFCS